MAQHARRMADETDGFTRAIEGFNQRDGGL